MTNDAFLSYSRRESKDFVTRLVSALEDRGKNCWVDLEDIPPASEFMEDLKEGIGGSDAFCFVLSPAALESEFCRRELEYAVERNKRIVPIAHRRLPKVPPEPLASHSWIPQEGLFDDDFDASVEELIAALETDVDWVRGHTRWGQRAESWQRSGGDRAALLRGQELRDAETWLAGQSGKKPAATAGHSEFILRSQRESRNRARRILSAVAVAMVVSLVLAGVALWQRSVAIEQRDHANSRALANVTVRVPDPTLAVLLSQEALDRAETPEAAAALQMAVSRLDRTRAFVQGSSFNGLAIGPDGTVYAGGTTGRVDAWHAETVGAHGFRLDDPHTVVASQTSKVAPVIALALSPDGQQLAVGTDPGPVRVAGVVDGTVSRTLSPGFVVSAMSFSPDGTGLAIGGTDGRVAIWDLRSGQRVRSLQAGTTHVMSLAYTPAGDALMTACDGGLTQLWRLDDGEAALVQPGGVAALSPDGGRIAVANVSGQNRGSLSVFAVDTGERVASFTSGNLDHVALAFTPDGSQIVAADTDGVLRLHEAGGEYLASLQGHAGWVSSIAFADGGRFMITASRDATIRVWELQMAQELKSFATPEEMLTAAKFSPDGTRVAIGGVGGWWMFDARTTEPLLSVDAGSAGVVFDVDFSPDGKRLATAEADGWARVWDAETGELVAEFGGHADAIVAAVTFSPDGNLIATTGSGEAEAARIWNAHDGSPVMVLTADGLGESAAEGARDVAFSPDGKVIATGTDEGAQTWDAATGELQLRFDGHDGTVSGLAFEPSGERIVSVGPDGAMLIWDTATGDHVTEVRTETGAPIEVDVSYDGRFTIAGYSNSQAAVFDLNRAQLGGNLLAFGGHRGRVLAVDFSPTDFRAVTVGEQGVAIVDRCVPCVPLPELRELAGQLVARELTDDERGLYLSF